ncbi:MAG: hypothetical protein ACKOGA_00410 [Planctomycetaceae bacterium]
MSFFGKILVLLQLALSILFLMFAGAVYTNHINWKTETEKQQKLVKKGADDLRNLTEEKEKELLTLKTERDTAAQRTQEVEAQLQLMTQQFETSKGQNARLQTESATARRQAQNSAEEASARSEEARELREVNHEQTGMLGSAEVKRAELEDEIRRLQGELDLSNAKNKALVAQLTQFTALLAKNGISPDEAVDLVSASQPPPQVEGKVRTVRRPAKLGNAELLGITLGMNDGLKKGHEMTVWRSAAASGGKPRYLAKIRIVTTAPDSAVGEVIEDSRSGAIQEGDNVSTKL